MVRHPSRIAGMHCSMARGALLNFLTASVGLLLLGLGVRKRNGRLAAWSMALGLTTIVSLILYNSQTLARPSSASGRVGWSA